MGVLGGGWCLEIAMVSYAAFGEGGENRFCPLDSNKVE